MGPVEQETSKILGSVHPPSLMSVDKDSLTIQNQRIHKALMYLAAEIDKHAGDQARHRDARRDALSSDRIEDLNVGL